MHGKSGIRSTAYGVAVLSTCLALLLRWPLWAVLGSNSPFLTLVPAVIVSAYVGGLWPGLFATVLGAATVDYFLLEPRYSFAISDKASATALALFVLIGTMISILSESLHRTRRRLLANERQHAEEAVRQTEERFRKLAENIREIFWMQEGNWRRTLYVSPNYADVWGRTCQSLYEQPRSWIDSVHPDDRAAVFASLEQQERGPTKIEFRVIRPDQTIRWVRCRAFPLKAPAGEPSRIAGLAEDITERKHAEEALRESEERFRAFVDHATDAFFLFDDTSVILDVNRQACQSLGYRRDELIGMTPRDLDPEITDAELESLGQRLDAGETVAFESKHRRKDGTVFPVEVKGQAFWEGGRRFTVALARDVTERKRAQEALRESEERFHMLADHIAQFAWIADETGSIFWYNRRWFDYTGTTAEEMQRVGWREIHHPEHARRVVAKFRRCIETGAVWEDTFPLRGKDGNYRWFLSRAVPIRDDSGKVIRWFGTNTDVTAQREATQAAEAANRAKDEFLANVSHEIRTPMTAILGMTELVLDTPLTDDQRQCLRTVKSAADNLLGIINDLLDFSKIEAGKFELDPADFSLRSAVADTLRALAVRAHEKGLELISHVDPRVPDALIGDAGRLRQVLLNLIGNAIKFTDEGEVVVRVSVDKETAADKETRRQGDKEKGRPGGEEEIAAAPVSLSPCLPVSLSSLPVSLSFEVRDTGIGISENKRERIFRAFEQEDTSTTRKYGGTGLGLTIASRLVALMGGKISVESRPGEGSTFSFTARFERQPHASEMVASRPPVPLYRLPVLIVDDNATNRHILEEWLRGWQMEPVSVGDGRAAMETLRAGAASGRPYALVLLDARMPDSDGLTLASTIRERAELSGIRIILLTSGDRPGDLALSREMRIDARLLKPIQQDELLEKIHEVMSRAKADHAGAVRSEPSDKSASAAVGSPAPLHVLVAEDNEFSGRLLEQLLSRRGHRVRLANDGRETLDLATGGDFDVLLLDLHMPHLDGFQVVQAIRERERLTGGHLPVIALTARSRKEDRERCLAAGMDDFLTKPVAGATLLAAIDQLASGDGDSRPAEVDSAPWKDLLDPVAVLRACGNDSAGLRRMCQDFHTYMPARVTEMREALLAGDAPRLRQAAHKSCALLLAFSTLAGNVASELENLAIDGRLVEAEPLLAGIEAMSEQLLRMASGLTLEGLCRQAEAAGTEATADG